MAAPRGKLADTWAKVAYYTSLGFILPAAVVGGVVVGWYLDGWLGTRPVLAAVMGALGAVAGFVEILRLMARAEQREGSNDTDNQTGSR